MTIEDAIKEMSDAVEAHKQLELDLSNRHIAEVLFLKSAKIGADKLAEALEVALQELKKDKTEDVLTDKEKAYLEAALKPFNDRIIYLEKMIMLGKYEFIFIKLNHLCEDDCFDFLQFPVYIRGTMYKNMELDRRYTLKELGLE